MASNNDDLDDAGWADLLKPLDKLRGPDRSRALELLRSSGGRPSRLSAAERDEALRLLKKAEVLQSAATLSRAVRGRVQRGLSQRRQRLAKDASAGPSELGVATSSAAGPPHAHQRRQRSADQLASDTVEFGGPVSGVSASCPRCNGSERYLVVPGFWRCNGAVLIDPGGRVGGPGLVNPLAGPPFIDLPPRYGSCGAEFRLDDGALTVDEKRTSDQAVRDLIAWRATAAAWTAETQMLSERIADPIERLVTTVAQFALPRQDWETLSRLLPGTFSSEDVREELYVNPPWDHEAVRAWFVRNVRAAPSDAPLSIRTSPARMFMRGFGWEETHRETRVPGWCFDAGSTHVFASETGLYQATISILADGRVTYGAGRLQPIGSNGDGFNATALRAMAELAGLAKLPSRPAFPLLVEPRAVDFQDIERRFARL